MKTWKIVTTITLTIVAAALFTGTALALFGQRAPNAAGIYTNTYPNGMMGGNGYPANGNYPTNNTPQITTPAYPNGGATWGCRSGTWGWNYGATGTTTAITLDSAVQTAQNYVASLNNPDLAVTEVEEYSQNFYAIVTEKSTGKGAFELLIDKYTGSVGPEMGPNMMWNTKYTVTNGFMGLLGRGMMGGTGGRGMMGGYNYGYNTGTATVTVEQAKTNAQQFLDVNYPGTTVGGVDTFYGYYHIDVESAGTTYGMLSVNGYTGQVWYHNWHGAYIQTAEL